MAVILGITGVFGLVVSCGSGSPEGGSDGSNASSDGVSPGVASTAEPAPGTAPADAGAGVESVSGPVRVGAAVAAAEGFARFQGLRVGLITNDAALVDGERVLDLLARAEGVELVAVFAPEHGVEADLPAGATVGDGDGGGPGAITVHSVYGEQRAPTQAALAELDVLVFDLQDVGVRAYTYLSTMGLSMVAADEAGIPFVVLDRPNPLGGELVSGFGRDADRASFISQYPVPAVHGLTAGELALAIKGEGWLGDLGGLQLEVVPVEGWTRQQRWGETGLRWEAPSPSLPTMEATALYPGIVLFEATSLSLGRGTAEPFQIVGGPWVDGVEAAEDLNGRGLAGVQAEAVRFTPEASAAVPNPPHEGVEVPGVRLVVTDPAALRPVEVGVHLLAVLSEQARLGGVGEIIDRPDTFDLLAGTDRLRLGLAEQRPASAIIADWGQDVTAFSRQRQPYLLYP